MKKPPVVLTIAGSDNSCGAGAQADLKTITALGCHAQTAITCVVAEVPGLVTAIQEVRPALVEEQIRLSLAAFPVAAVKTGMLHSTPVIKAVARALGALRQPPPLVVDPVMVASSGDPLLKPSAITAYNDLLFPLAALVTPNLDELRVLSGMPCADIAGIKEAGAALVRRHGVPFLLKGGHLGSSKATDILVTAVDFTTFTAPFKKGGGDHGTGCTLSAAIAACLARGLPLPEAVATAKRFITAAIRGTLRWGSTAVLDQTVTVTPQRQKGRSPARRG